MGKASRRHAAQRATKALMTGIDRTVFAQALRRTILAVTDFHGADCLLYAGVGALALRKLGLPAAVCAGSCVWRVGPGDSDVISHASEINGAAFAPVTEGQVAMFHAWIELDADTIDFSTFSLHEKAADLVEHTGEPLRVDWAPDFLWAPKSEGTSLRGAVQAPTAPAYAYLRKPQIEQTVLSSMPQDRELDALASAVLIAYRSLLAGEELRVVGIGPDGSTQTQPAAARSYRAI